MATVQVITDSHALAAVLGAWGDLVIRSPRSTVFQTPEWAYGWWRALDGGSMPFCIALWDQDRLVGFAPLVIETQLGARVLRFMAAPGDDCARALIEPSYAQSFPDVFAATLRQHAHAWDVLCLEELDHEPASLSGAFPASSKFGIQPLNASSLPILDMPLDWEGYWKHFSHQRRWAFKKTRRLLAEHGKVSFEVFTTPDAIQRELPLFFAARQENWQQRKRWRHIVAFQRVPIYYERLTRVCVELAERGQVWLACLMVDEKPVSWNLAFCVNHIVSFFMTTFDVAYGASSPGYLVLLELIHYAIDHQFIRFELGRGAQPFKFTFGAVAHANKHFLVYTKRPRSFPLLGQELVRDQALGLIHRLRHG